MGLYLNSRRPRNNYLEIVRSDYFTDKTMMLKELFPLLGNGDIVCSQSDEQTGQSSKYICITRPRRFGKTVAASMIAAFFEKGFDSRKIFGGLEISTCRQYEEHLNQHNVIYITLSECPDECSTYRQYISRIKRRIMNDLAHEFPNACIDTEDALWDVFNNIYELEREVKFIFVLDEWDFVFHRDFLTENDKHEYLSFLSNLLKDQPYVELAYMTGILPIAKYSSGSELNMFLEYTMATEEKYCEYFGFTETEVDALYQKYITRTRNARVAREGLRLWYDGYHTRTGRHIYNPRSVTAALTNNNLGNYWTSSGPYDEIFYYISKNIDDVRDALVLMISKEAVPAKVREYAAVSMNLTTKEEILSAMVVYGFLTSENGKVFIPNKELMDQFETTLLKEPSLGYVHRLAKESDRMLLATLAGDTDTMLEILEYAHNTEIPLLSYNNETDLTAVVNLIYLSARDTYRIEREDKAGIGYVDFIFYPKTPKDDCIIIELKVNHTPAEAIQQIKDRGYALRFSGKLAEKNEYTGRILAVGITYDKAIKTHDCKIEILKTF